MNFDYQFDLPVPVERVWATLMDIPRVAPCMPGASIETSDGNSHIGKVRVKLGPIELTYRGAVTLVQRDDVQHKANVNVVAKEINGAGAARADLTLGVTEFAPGSARVSVSSEFSISGKAAQFGRGVVDEVAALMMGQFAERLARLLQEEDAPSTQAPTPVPTSSMPAAGVAVLEEPRTSTFSSTTAQNAESTPNPMLSHETGLMLTQMLNATTAAANAAVAAANAASAAVAAVSAIQSRVNGLGGGPFGHANEALDMGNVMGAVLYRRLKWVVVASVVVVAAGVFFYLGGRY